MHIEFQKRVAADHIPKRTAIKKWLLEAMNHIPEKIPSHQNEMTIRIIGREESAELNEHFRHKKGPTNVLAFMDKPLAGLAPDTLGDLAICADVVKQEAEEQGKLLESHWAHMIVHGFLHLMGYDHLDKGDAEKMESKEIEILTALGFENPYQ
ncbi:MAG: rRNA maturation RNase YbeY [Coxiella sp. RIFCSPHIGHO2_12_FULL_42_15]|nr:MAG: rRNA maturation RNase YbeY [Coxiella sp. RIFCSPHIGHO2_12_FULL_42_15]